MAEILMPPFATTRHTVINAALLGNNTIQAAPGVGSRLRLVEIVFITTLANNITLLSGATALSGALPFAANTGINWSASTFLATIDCGGNEAFILNFSVATQVSGWIKFVVAPT
jgi:hypothetical protein